MAGVLNAGDAPAPNPNLPGVQGVLTAPQTAPAFGANAPGVPPSQPPFSLRQPYFAGQPQPNFAAGAPGAGDAAAQGAADPQAPPPTYRQTLAAMRHFSALRREIAHVLKDPDVGKANLKGKIVDGISDLVADRILTPSEAVEQLSQVPPRPFDQKTWLQQQYINTHHAETMLLAHYRQGLAQSGDDARTIDTSGGPDTHSQDMSGLVQNYQSAIAARRQRSAARGPRPPKAEPSNRPMFGRGSA